MNDMPVMDRKEQSFEAFKAEREAALKKHIDGLPRSYFGREYVDAEGKKTANVEWLDGVLAKLNRRVTKRILVLCHHLSDVIGEKGLAPLRDRIKALEKTVEEMKSAQTKTLADAFRGSWQPNTGYARGSLVVKDGGLWLSMADTTAKPGTDDSWRLVTKAGKDGRDLRS